MYDAARGVPRDAGVEIGSASWVRMLTWLWLGVLVADNNLGDKGGSAVVKALQHVPNVTYLGLGCKWCV